MVKAIALYFPMQINYKCISFEAFTLDELYAVMRLRQEVFVVEQDCPYLDADGLDQPALHVLGVNTQGGIMAYTRLLPKGTLYENYVAIGRVLTAQSIRGRGLGYELMEKSISFVEQYYGKGSIRISAQYHLMNFYQALGFQPIGQQYLEDNIPHIAMLRNEI